MNRSSRQELAGEARLREVLWEDGERRFCRIWRGATDGDGQAFLAVFPSAEHPTAESIRRLTHEHALKDYLDTAWALRPLDLMPEHGLTVLVLEYCEGVPLDRLIRARLELGPFLRLAVALGSAVARMHERGLVHKDIKPTNILVDPAGERVWLTGFGVATRVQREHQSPQPPELIAGTLAYMAPEQTGRMNRSIDSRSDLYSLGVTLYQALTGVLPFTASDPMEWVHNHIARKPASPSKWVESVPFQVSAIIMKLLAKTPEERYQTAAGVERDFRRCLADWQTRRTIDEFPPGRNDAPSRLVIPEKLYGRAREVETLLASFDRIVKSGRAEMVLVSGYSGIGKSAVVNELHRALVPPRGLFASGKFDQYKRDIPYATIAQAFQSLTRFLLSKSEAELSGWRDALHEALDPNGQLMVALVPELQAVIGEQPSVPELPQQEAQRRFHLVFRRFIKVFARPEHPLALFLDDLQWLDTATLDLLQDLLTQPEVQHLMLIGAYRDNEVNATHPLMRTLLAIREAGASLRTIALAPLERGDLEQLIADSLCSERSHAIPLAELVHEKTGGNPFFAIQFISSLADEGLLAFDQGEGQWYWDLDRIHARGYTENVIDLMVRKLSRLSPETQDALKQLACLGSSATFTMVGVVYQDSAERLHAHLAEAVGAGFVLRSDDSYHFLHDRVHEAAYSLIPSEQRAEAHLRIGLLMASHTPPANLETEIFEIVNQLNRGLHLITSMSEGNRVAALNLTAGRRAKSSAAYASAIKYLEAARGLLPDESWARDYELVFSIEYLRAECEVLTADMAVAENRLAMLSKRAKSAHDIALVTRLSLTLYTALDRSDRAVEVFLEYWRGRGADWSAHPTEDEVSREYDRIWFLLGDRQIEDLLHLPLLSNPDVLDLLDVFTEVVTPALFIDARFLDLVVCRMVSLSLEHGNSDASCYAYMWLGLLAGPHFGNYQTGFRLGKLGYDLVEGRGLRRYQPRTYMCFGVFITPWTKHVKSGRDLVRRTFDAANKIGDLTYAAYSCNALNTNLLAAGDPLEEVQREVEVGLEFANNIGFGLVIDCITAQLGLIRSLRGLTPTFGMFSDGRFEEPQFEAHLASAPVLALPQCWYWIRKLQARFFAGDYLSAVQASLKAERLLWTSPSFFEVAEYHYYAALSRAALVDTATGDVRRQHIDALVAHQEQQAVWAKNCPENFENRAALVGAEIARIQGRLLEAEDLYEEAIRSASRNGFVPNEAISNELAGRFYAGRGFDKIATTYLRDARYCYRRWGADGKVRQMEDFYPQLGADKPLVDPTATFLAPVEQLDLATVIKVSEAVSGEIVLEKLIDTLMRAAIEHAGAERGLLILPDGDEFRIEAEATTRGADVQVDMRHSSVTPADLPESVFRYALRTKECVLTHGASEQSPLARDEQVRQHYARSVLCLPLVKQTRLVGLIYLENDLASDVFTSARVAVLKLLASEAAISLENVRLYRELQEREARVRRLVDSNIIGIAIWHADGRILDTNEAFLRIVGYDRQDLISGAVRWTDLTPLERRAPDALALAEIGNSGTVQAHEREYVRKDGTRVAVLAAGATFDGAPDEGVSFVLDLTDRKRAESAQRESERESRLIVDTIPGLVALLSPTGELEVVNSQLLQYFGRTLEELKRWGTNDTIHPDDLPHVIEVFSQSIKSGTPYDILQRFRRSDGIYRWFQNSGRPLRDSAGQVARWCVLLTDIDELKRAEAAIAASERDLKVTIDAMPALAWSTTPAGAADFFNKHYLEYVGLSVEEASGWGWTGAVHPDDINSLADTWQSCLRDGVSGEAEARMRRHDGEYRWFLFRASPLRDESGTIVQWYGVNADIEDRKRAEAELRRTYTYLAEAQRLSRCGSFFSDLATNERIWSDEMFGILDVDPATPVTSHLLRSMVHPDDLLSFDEQFAQLLAGHNLRTSFRVVTAGGAVKHLRSVCHIVDWNEGRPVCVGAVQDVTETVAAEEALNSARSELAHVARAATVSALTASIAHEVNQPLSGIVTNASTCVRMLDATPPNIDGARETARRTIRDAHLASEVIARLRALFSKKDFALEPMDLNEATREVVALSLRDLQKNRLTVQSELAEDLPAVTGDRIQLQQVILNLLRNASEAMAAVDDRPRRLLIRTEREGDESVTVTVRDSGVGIDPLILERIFDPFYTTKGSGMGIGLSVSRTIIEQHHGRLWVEPNDGPGATFAFSIPCLLDAAESVQSTMRNL